MNVRQPYEPPERCFGCRLVNVCILSQKLGDPNCPMVKDPDRKNCGSQRKDERTLKLEL